MTTRIVPFARPIAAMAAVLLLVTACGGKPAPTAPAGDKGGAAPQKLDKLDVQLAWLMNTQAAAIAAADKEGFYKKHGLDVVLHAGGPNVDPIQNVVSGKMQVGIANSNGTLTIARSQGVPVKAIGTIYQKHPYAFIFKPESGITKPEDLKGKNVGIQSTGHYLLTAFLGKVGMKESDVKVITIGSDMVPLANNQVDAASAWMVNAGQLAAVPNGKYFLTYDYGLRFYANTIFTTDKVIKDSPDLLKRFMAATMEGLAFAMDNPEKATQDVMDSAQNLNRDIELKTLQLSIPLFSSAATKTNGLGYIDKQVFQDGQQILLDTQQMKNKVNADDLVTVEFITNNTPKR